MNASSISLVYGEDKTLEISLDTRDFFLDGKKGSFTSVACRDFVLAVIKSAPKTATANILMGAVRSATSLKKLQHNAKNAFEKVGLKVPVIEAVRAEGYQLAGNWRKNARSVAQKHLAYDLLDQLVTVLKNACAHVDKTHIQTNTIGLMYVERTAMTRNLAATNYTMIEDVGWQLIHVLSSSGGSNKDLPYVHEIKKKIEKIISYALFWRIGDGLTVEKWRSDFHSESQKLVADIKILIEQTLSRALENDAVKSS